MKCTKDSIKVFVLIITIVLASCSREPIGPSDEKVRLDMDEKIGKLSKGLVDVAEFEINSREVLPEDRVKFHITVKLKKNEEKIAHFKKRSYKMFGPSHGPNRKHVRTAWEMDNKTELATWQYESDKSGVWLLSKDETGHL